MRQDLKEFSSTEFAKLSRIAAREGIVLLKNEENVLPFGKDEVISIFGRPQIEYYRSGTGSGGSVATAYKTNIIDGFRNNEIKINEELYNDYVEWLKDNPFDNGGGGWAAEPWFQKDMDITLEYSRAQAKKSDKAVYIVGRTAGEDKDNADWPGSYQLTEQEKENLKNITAAFDNVCLILNINNIIDINWIDDYQYSNHIKSVVIVWGGGMEGGNAVGDVLSGNVSPSGKLPDTIAKSINDYPSTKNFGNELKNLYEEDIYVGYRYFETFEPDKVLYEFGFGLSYTDFDIETVDASEKDGVITVKTKVTNTGDKFSGKEVVQVYCEAPQGKLGKPKKVLVAFAKTDELAPKESQELELTIDVKSLASYDDSGVTGHKSCYVLESGDYKLYVGNSVRNNSEVFTYSVARIKVVEELSEAMCPDDNDLKLLKPGALKEDGTYEKTYVPSQHPTVDMAKRIEDNLPETMEITGNKGINIQDVKAGKNTLDEFVAQLEIEELATLVRGEGMSNPRVTQGTASAFGGLSDTLFNLGVPAACCADGPSGLRMDGEVTQLPIGTNLSSTWDAKLVRDLYTMEGQELYRNNVDTLLGPGVNIHRNPLNGRNFEYYSEDPFLSGTIAVAACGGIKDGGAWGTIKHFALNGQEAHRFKIDAVCSERAIREIYLKTFEMAVKEKTVKTLMTSYNPINGYWAASNYDLCTTILRGEWGYDGLVMTDWWAKMNDVVEKGEESNKKIRDMVRSQNDVYMVVNNNGAEINSNEDDTEQAVEEGRLTIGELQRAAKNILNVILSSKCIDNELVDPDKAEHFDALPLDQAKYDTYNLNDSDKVPMLEKKEASMIVEDATDYTIIVDIAFDKHNLFQSTVNVKSEDDTMFVIQTNGTDGKWIRQKLGKVSLDKGVYNLKLEEVLAGIKVKYIQFKKIEKK